MTTDRIPSYAPMDSDEAADLALGVIQKGGDDIAALALMLHAIHLDLQALGKPQEAAPTELHVNLTGEYAAADKGELAKAAAEAMRRNGARL